MMSTDDEVSGSPAGWVLTVPVGAACLIVAMKALDVAGGASIPAAIGTAAVLSGLLVVLDRGRIRARRMRLDRWSLLPVLTLLGVAVGLWFRAVQRVLDTPVVFGVDPARHISMTAWIAEHQRLVHGVEPQLGSLSNYPPGAHVLAATLTWASGLSPMTTTWVVALAATMVTLLLVAVLAGEVMTRRSPVPGAVALCLCIVAWRFTIGMVTYEFYFAQVVGITLSVAGVLAVLRGIGLRRRWWRWLPVAIVCALASYLTYPQQALVVPVAAAAGLLAARREAGRRLTLRTVTLFLIGAVAVAAVGLLVLHRAGYLQSRALFGNDDGFVTTLSLSRVGGWVPCVLVLWGTLVVLGAAVGRRNAAATVLSAAFAVPVALASGLWLLQRGIPFEVAVTRYRVAKNVFMAVPFAAAAAGVGVASVAPGRPRWAGLARSRFLAVAVAAVTILVPFQPRTMSNTRDPVVSHDAYELARWAARRYDVTDIGVVGADLEPFTLWVTGLRRPLDPDPGVLLLPISTRWLNWPDGPEAERYLLTSGRRMTARFAGRDGVVVIRRMGDAALLASDRLNSVG